MEPVGDFAGDDAEALLCEGFGGLTVDGRFWEGGEFGECGVVEVDEVGARAGMVDDAGEASGLEGVGVAARLLDGREEAEG